MADAAHQEPRDLDALAEFLSALAYGSRLELLSLLRFPHTLAEIKLAARRVRPGENPRRPASIPTVRAHLQKLLEADLVRQENVPGPGKSVHRFAANSPKLFALTEELRGLMILYAGRAPTDDATGTMAAGSEPATATGPRLVLVHGVYEGKSFALGRETAQDGHWTIGRARGVPVSLHYDPFISLENSAIEDRGDAFWITDLATSKNGTAVNWSRLPKGGGQRLKTGDIIGVGKSLLSFVKD